MKRRIREKGEVALNVDREEMMRRRGEVKEGRRVILKLVKEGRREVMKKKMKERRIVKVVERRSILG